MAAADEPTAHLGEVARVALRLGLTAFGGPAAHIAMLREQVVVRRQWLTESEFLDLLGATHLIPGPNSTEMVIHVSRRRAGWAGFAVGGLLFILPAALMVLAFAWMYVEYGRTPAAGWVLYGIKPVIIAVVVQAIWGLSRTSLRTLRMASVAIAALALSLAGGNELLILFGGGALLLLVRFARGARARMSVVWLPLLATVHAAAATQIAPTLPRLFATFLKIGSVLYGSGYVLIAFLRNEFIVRLGWLTDQQLLDAVAVGQFTPGPVFTTATFVGYVVGGWSGAAAATIAIFLPSFVFVAISYRFVPLLRASPLLSALLDGVNAAALGLMAAVVWQLGRSAILDHFTLTLALIAAVLLIRWNVNSAWLVLGGAVAAVIARLV